MTMIPEFRSITGLIENGYLFHEEIGSMPSTSQKKMYRLMKQLMKDELVFVIELEKRQMRMSGR